MQLPESHGEGLMALPAGECVEMCSLLWFITAELPLGFS